MKPSPRKPIDSALRAAAKREFLVVVAFLVCTSPLRACPMCKDSTVDTDKPAATESAGLDFNKSIYIMLGGFITVVGFSGRVMYRAVTQKPKHAVRRAPFAAEL